MTESSLAAFESRDLPATPISFMLFSTPPGALSYVRLARPKVLPRLYVREASGSGGGLVVWWSCLSKIYGCTPVPP